MNALADRPKNRIEIKGHGLPPDTGLRTGVER
jgi:hypothetical protein